MVPEPHRENLHTHNVTYLLSNTHFKYAQVRTPTQTRAQRNNLTQHTAIFCSNALSKMSGKEEQKHTVVSMNSISKPLQEKQKLSNGHNGQRLVQRGQALQSNCHELTK